ELAGQNVESNVLGMILNRLLVGGESLGSGAFGGLHLSQLEQSVRVIAVEVDSLAEGSLGAAQIVLVLEQRGPQQVVESAAGGHFGDPRTGRRNGLVGLFFGQVGVHDALQGVGGSSIFFEG